MSTALSSTSHTTSVENALPRWFYLLQVAVVATVVMAPAFSIENAKHAAGDETGKTSLLEKLETPNRIRQLAYTVSVLGFGLTGAFFFWRSGNRARNSPLLFGLSLSLLAIILASILWSEDRSLSFRRIVIFEMVAFGAIGLGARWRPIDFTQMVLVLSSVMLFVGIVAELRVGTFLGGSGYRFSGLLHPNKQASSLALLVVASAVTWLRNRQLSMALLAGAALGMLVLTGSRGGLLTCFAGLTTIGWLMSNGGTRLRLLLASVSLLGIALLLFALIPNLGSDIMDAARLGRQGASADPSKLTGRLPIWAEIIANIKERPLLGYGYSGFWTTERIYKLSYIHKWEFSNAHSTYLDSLLSVGIAGFSIGLLALLGVIVKGCKHVRHSGNLGILFAVAVVVMGLVNSLTESIFYGDGYEPLCVMIAAFVIMYHPNTSEGDADD